MHHRDRNAHADMADIRHDRKPKPKPTPKPSRLGDWIALVITVTLLAGVLASLRWH